MFLFWFGIGFQQLTGARVMMINSSQLQSSSSSILIIERRRVTLCHRIIVVRRLRISEQRILWSVVNNVNTAQRWRQ